MGKGRLASLLFKEDLRGLGRGCVKQHDRCRIPLERRHNAGELLGQHPHAVAGMASRKPELDQLASPLFHVFWGRVVIKEDESVGALKKQIDSFQLKFKLVLLADNK